MSLRTIKERAKVLSVENDLRGLGNLVNERPPQYELHLKICDQKEDAVKQLAAIRGFHADPQSHGHILGTREQIPHHEQAVWHFFMAVEMLQHDLISSAEIHLVNPMEKLLLNEKTPHPRRSHQDTGSALLMDASVALFMLKAGHWRSQFSEQDIIQEIKSKGHSYLALERATISLLVQDFKTSTQSQKTGELRNAR